MVLFLRKLKRCIPFLIALALLIGLLPPVEANALEVVDSGTINNLSWSLTDDNVLHISGDGDIPDYTLGSAPWYEYRTTVTSIVFSTGVRGIGDYSFYGFTSLTSITIPSVQNIGNYAFYGCSALTSLDLSDTSVQTIGNYAFQGCYNLVSIEFGYGTFSIGDYAFKSCSALTVVDIPSWLTSIGTDAFYSGSSSKITSIILNGSSTIKTLPTYDMVYSGVPYCIFVDPFLLDDYREAYPNYAFRFCEYQSDWTDNIVPITDYMTSSTSTSSATISNYEISDAWYFDSGTSLYCSALPYNYLFNTSKWYSILDPNDKIFSFGGLKSVSYMDLTVSCTYTATGTASYTGSRSLYVYFYDSAGTLISSTRYGYTSGTKLVSGTKTVSCTTESIEVPDNAAYWGCFMEVHGFSGLTVTSKCFDVDLTLTSALVVPPVIPSVSSTTLKSYEYDLNTAASALSVNASVTDAGVLSYQWYENTTNSTTGGTAISGATSATYTPSTGSAGTKYYYCKVTNTLDGLSTVAYSDVATVKVVARCNYQIYLDGSLILSPTLESTSATVVLKVYPDYFRIYFDGYEEDYYYREDYTFTSYMFAGLSLSDPELETIDYPVGSTHEITLTMDSPTLELHTMIHNILYVDPNGGTWNGTTGVSSFGDFWGCDKDDITPPTRSGYLFTGWTFTGAGSFDQSDISKAIYTFGDGIGYLTANWEVDPDALFTTITIDGESFAFPGTDASPDIQAFITESGCVLTDGSVTYTWTYPGEGEFAGLSLYTDGSDPFPVGTSGTLPGTTGDHTDYVVYSVETKQATFVIGDQSCVFLGTVSSTPEITIDVLSGGVSLHDGTTSYFYEHGSNVVGYKLSPDADAYIGIGESYIFVGSDTYSQTLYPIYFTDVEFYTRVNIYDSSGTKLLGSYDFATLGAAPAVSLTVLGNGCKFVFGDTVYSWSAGSTRFYGLSPAMYVAKPYYVPGNAYTLPGGEPVNLTIDLYVHDTENSGLPALDFVEWLKVAVGGFLDFEIFPSLSLDEILYFILVVQLLLWFLKVIK